MADIAIKNLGKRFARGAPVLDDISIDIRSGEFIVLVGPSGCGKSTLLRCIAGLETPTEGHIEVDGVRIDHLPPAERGIGMVFQDYALYPHMNVRENLSFGLRIKRFPKAEIQARITDAASILGLEALLDRKPSELSGGQRQRVAIGRALVKRPALFLLDEPLSNLDAQLRSQTRLEIAALHRRIKSTTLYVTHDQEEAMTLADRIVVLKSGRLQQIASPLELYHRPVNRFVASFIGSPRMNMIKGELEFKKTEAVFRVGDQQLKFLSPDAPKSSGSYLLGFRPENFRLSNQGISLELEWIENHGYDVHLIARFDGQRVTLRMPERGLSKRIEVGEKFSVEISPESIHWFSPEEDQRRVEISQVRSVA